MQLWLISVIKNANIVRIVYNLFHWFLYCRRRRLEWGVLCMYRRLVSRQYRRYLRSVRRPAWWDWVRFRLPFRSFLWWHNSVLKSGYRFTHLFGCHSQGCLVAPTLSVGSVLLQQAAISASFHYNNVEIVESRPNATVNWNRSRITSQSRYN